MRQTQRVGSTGGFVRNEVSGPAHYTVHPSGVECIGVTAYMGFLAGNALKYVWRAGLKGPAREDYEKAQQYLRWFIDASLMGTGDTHTGGDFAWKQLQLVIEHEPDADKKELFGLFAKMIVDPVFAASELVSVIDRILGGLADE